MRCDGAPWRWYFAPALSQTLVCKRLQLSRAGAQNHAGFNFQRHSEAFYFLLRVLPPPELFSPPGPSPSSARDERTVDRIVSSDWSGTWKDPLSEKNPQREHHKRGLHFLKICFPIANLKERKQKHVLSDSLTAWEVTRGRDEKAAFGAPELHLGPLTARV